MTPRLPAIRYEAMPETNHYYRIFKNRRLNHNLTATPVKPIRSKFDWAARLDLFTGARHPLVRIGCGMGYSETVIVAEMLDATVSFALTAHGFIVIVP